MNVDAKTFRIAVLLLGIALLACIAGICTLSALHDMIPDSLTTIAGVVGGALAGLFVTPHQSEPTPVSVVDQPVAVTDAPARRKRRGDAGEASGLLVLAVIVLLIALIGGFTATHLLFWLLIVVVVLAVVGLL